jgi:hypothetical protein
MFSTLLYIFSVLATLAFGVPGSTGRSKWSRNASFSLAAVEHWPHFGSTLAGS